MATTLSKLLLFLGLPMLAGIFGLYAAYLKQFKEPDRKLSIEADFGLPFTIALLLVVVIGFQTNGYTTSQRKPLVNWPKVKKTRKITHKHVVKGVDEGADADEKEPETKKND
mmetsp:Transcript_9367/g.19654  ORF Transcript_9367/g.19654 Transcript_9367/m.19654 type:complete len:112 (+) Transcript_9367:120-455(+)